MQNTNLNAALHPVAPNQSDAARDYLAAVVDSAADPIISTDSAGRILSWNRSATRMFGYSAAEMLGQQMPLLFPPELQADGSAKSRETPVSQTTQQHEARCRTRAGIAMSVVFTESPVLNASGQRIGTSRIIREIPKQKTPENRLNEIKDEFLSNVSHELRTPLTSLRAAVHLLLRISVDADEQQKRLLGIANANVERLLRLVNEILDFERLASGCAFLEMAPCTINEVVVPALEAISPLALELNIQLRQCIEGDAGQIELLADVARLQQVLLNLLSNALKFSPVKTPVTVTASVESGDLILAVRDEGPGIPQGKLETIFERFLQADSSDSRRHGGVGLGLAISRKIVQEHKGTIWAERNDTRMGGDVGTTFFIRLPAAPARSETTTRDRNYSLPPESLGHFRDTAPSEPPVRFL